MEDIKIKVQIKVQKTPTFEEVEITLPCYRRSETKNCNFWKVFNNEYAFYVCVVPDRETIGIHCISTAIDNTIDCTKEEFDAAYAETLAILNSKL